MSGDMSTYVVLKVAEKEGMHPLDLPLLSESINPDALNMLTDSPVAVSFDYYGYTVHICPEGVITLIE